MTSQQPTDKERQWFWEQCGWKPLYDRYEGERYIVLWEHESGDCTKDSSPPPIDPNNLFEYAVPKLNEYRIELYKNRKRDWRVSIYNADFDIDIDNKDPAIALFQAIYKAFGGNDKAKI